MSGPINLPGHVHAIGRVAWPAAQTYAALTGRSCHLVSDIDEIQVDNHDVVVCTTENLNPLLMYRIYVHGGARAAAGLICAATAGELERVCRRIAKCQADRQQARGRVFISSSLGFTSKHHGTDTWIGGLESSGNLIPALTKPKDLLVVTGPSNGFALGLSLRQYACPFLEGEVNAAGLLPSCQLTGKCTNFPTRPEIGQAQEKRWIVPLSELQAEIGVLYGCSLVRHHDGLFDAAYALGPALLRHSGLGTVITTWRREYGLESGLHLNGLINDLSSGATVGTAVRSFNDSAFATQFGVKLCVLGDPCVSLNVEEPYSALPIKPIEPKILSVPATPSKERTIQEANLLGAVIKTALEKNPCYNPQKGRDLMGHLSSYLERERRALSEPDPPELGRMDAALVDFFSDFPLLDSVFAPFSLVQDISEEGICPACSAPARRSQALFPGCEGKKFCVVSCACCSESEYLPSEWNVKLELGRISEGIISMTNVPPGAQVTVCLLSQPEKELCGRYLWGNPHRSLFQLPEPEAPTPFYCQILIADQLQFGSFGFKVRWQGQNWKSPLFASRSRSLATL